MGRFFTYVVLLQFQVWLLLVLGFILECLCIKDLKLLHSIDVKQEFNYICIPDCFCKKTVPLLCPTFLTVVSFRELNSNKLKV